MPMAYKVQVHMEKLTFFPDQHFYSFSNLDLKSRQNVNAPPDDPNDIHIRFLNSHSGEDIDAIRSSSGRNSPAVHYLNRSATDIPQHSPPHYHSLQVSDELF